jgi:hypothetical protein
MALRNTCPGLLRDGETTASHFSDTGVDRQSTRRHTTGGIFKKWKEVGSGNHQSLSFFLCQGWMLLRNSKEKPPFL